MIPPMIYVAAPYSHPDPAIRTQRFEVVTLYTAQLLKSGLFAYSPLTHTHPLQLALQRFGVEDYPWLTLDEKFMEICTGCHILCLPGWDASKGVAYELAYFKARNVPVHYEGLYDASTV